MNLAPHTGRGLADPARRLLVMMFCAGMYAMLSQVLLLRELLVAFYGNELTIGAMLSAWLVIIGAGSLAVRPLLRRIARPAWQWGVVLLLILLAALLPAQIWMIRIIRSILHVPYGEYVPFSAMLVSTSLLLLPSCLSLGILFPCACHLAGGQDFRAVGRLYAVESLGSMIGGGLFTFVLVLWLTPLAMLSVAAMIALVGAAIVATRAAVRRCLLLPILGLAVAATCPRYLSDLEWKSTEARWRAFGCLPESAGLTSSLFSRSTSGSPAPGAMAGAGTSARLVASVDSRYQNLALLEAEGQMTLYGNGQVLAVFPDPITGEHKIHFIMAQNPAAATVLLIGGNPVTDLPELLKYPLKRLVHVELDGEISRLLDLTGGRDYWKAVSDPRYCEATADGPRFVKITREKFDVVLVAAPEPTTIALNRYYTVDFYEAVKQRLAPGGFMYTSIEASELMQDEAAGLSASIHRSLKSVFPRVLTAAGTRNQFFAGLDASPLTFDRQVLFRRSADAGLRHKYFRPEYFLNADEISPDKTAYVENRLGAIPAPVNTALHPISTFYHLILWSRFSNSRLDRLLDGLGQLQIDRLAEIILSAGGVLFLAGLGFGIIRRRNNLSGAAGFHRRWARGMLLLVMATTGCCGLALELALIVVFQSLLGYIYVRIGLIVAVFMLGLMLGAMTANRMATLSRGSRWIVIGADLLLLGLALAIPPFMIRVLHSMASIESGMLVEALVDGFILLAGGAVGAQFVAINHELQELGMPPGSAAASANAADLFGAAVGGLTIGVVWLPLWGITASCLLLAALKGASLLTLGAGRLALRTSY